ncbi:hypothetical protein ONZ45_g17054 [Pleurotus djamor]|nr:hypothetical protein ONZ45_g17054 [Pleurotus djamor]
MGLVFVVGGLLCYLFFHHFEPDHPLAHLMSLVVTPIILCLVSTPYPSINVLLKALTIYMGTVLLSVVFYRISPFHPLAKYPGPVLAKVTKLWPAWIATSGKQHIWNRELHSKYGEVVRIGPNDLSIIDPEAINPLLGAKELPKGPSWKGRQASMKTSSLIGVQDVQEHARRRRPWSRGLSTTALKDYEGILMNRVRQLANYLAQQTGPVDLSEWIGYFTYDFMSDMGFGGGPEMMRDGDKDGLLKILDGGLLLVPGFPPSSASSFAAHFHFSGRV